jgi:hypothetical protein
VLLPRQFLKTLPITSNGKIDKAYATGRYWRSGQHDPYSQDLTRTVKEEGIEKLWGYKTRYSYAHITHILRKREAQMLEALIVILIVLWLLGFLGPRASRSIPQTGNLIHILLVVILILVIIRLF